MASKPDLSDPWKRQGVAVKGAMTTADAIRKAKLDWEVIKTPAGFMDGRKFTAIGDDVYVRRADIPGAAGTLARATDLYHPLQNVDAFTMMDDVAGKPDLAVIETAGFINGGTNVWIQMRIPGLTFEPIKGDVVQDYITIFNSHAADRALLVIDTPIRLASRATIMRGVGKAGGQLRIKHSGQMKARLRTGTEILHLEIELFRNWSEQALALARQQYTEADALQFALDIIQCGRIKGASPYKAAKSIEDLQAKQRAIGERLMALMESGRGTDIKGVRGTGWGMLNAVAEYVDHYGLETNGRPSTRSLDDRRLQYMMFGNGATLKDNALRWLTDGRDALLGVK